MVTKLTDKWRASKIQTTKFCRQQFLFKLETSQMHQRTVTLTSDDHVSFMYLLKT